MNYGKLLTAMVTPFNNSLEIDWESVDALVDHMLKTGTEGIVVAGTTGESPTLSKDEKLALFERVVKRANGNAKVIAGTGSNHTVETIALTKAAQNVGVDGIMLVVPYYSKPSQEGLYQHFKTVAENTILPVMLYNIPGRAGVNMTADTIIRLSQIPNITSVKEASGDLSQMATIIENTSEDFLLYSGDDKLLLPTLAIGGHGIVSVASHVIGGEMNDLIHAYFEGNVQEAGRLHRKLLPIFEGIFFVASPAPIKAALEIIGVRVGGVRLPLVALNDEQKDVIKRLINGK